jgi:2-iminobutanoate/2-iminopropanoate deaminase
MPRQVVMTDRVARPRVPLSSAVKAGGLVFVSGTVAFAPDGQIARGDVRAQVRQTLDNIKAVLEAAGSSLDKAVKINVILTRASDFAAMNEVYREYFREGNYPARTTIEARLMNPDLLIEIECVAEA